MPKWFRIQKGRNEKETVCRNLALLEQGRTRARNHKGRTHMPQKPCAAITPTITGREGGLRGDAFDGATQTTILKYEAAGDTSATERNNHIQKGRNEKETVCQPKAHCGLSHPKKRWHAGVRGQVGSM